MSLSTSDKLRILCEASKYDICASMSTNRVSNEPSKKSIGNPATIGICHAFAPNGRCISLFKALLTNHCIHDCKYCMNSCSRNKQKTLFQPQELARIFMGLFIRNYVEGLFLSSAVWRSPESTMELIIETVELLRKKYHFDGYIHAKVIPGAPMHLIQQLVELSDRVSLNIEVPDASHLNEVCSTKDYSCDLKQCQERIARLAKRGKIPAGHTTQFVVGVSDESDLEILNCVKNQYQKLQLKRAYFQAFDPIKGTLFANHPAESLTRENYLYRTDWLMRIYKYEIDEIQPILKDDGMLSLDHDPKLLIALQDERFPIDINNAPLSDLLHVPGIGSISAQRIIKLRQLRRNLTCTDLQNLGVVLKRAKPFLIINKRIETKLTDYFKFAK